MAVEKVTEIPKLIKDARQRQYLPSDELGSGGFATCWRARMIDRREPPESSECALKAVKAKIPANLSQRFRLELAIQSKLQHPNIVKMFRAFTFQEITYVALELAPNGSLTDMMKKRKFLTMGEIRRILIQLCGAVKYLHKRDVVHRDIKAGNIFLDEDMNVKLGDFGLAAIMEPGDVSTYARRTTFCGTPNYLAPEILSRDGSGHGMSVDIWAIGILAYYLAVGRAPFHSKSRDEIYQRLRKGEYSWPEIAPDQNEIPEDLRSLVASLLVIESRRPTPDQIVRHPFFRGFIPDRLDPLCKLKRPRWARVGGMNDSTKTYEDLCRASGVGISIVHSSKKSTKQMSSLFLVLAEELEQSPKLTIPLKEGRVYIGHRPLVQSVSTPAPIILEDSSSTLHSRSSSSSDAVSCAPVTREVANPPRPKSAVASKIAQFETRANNTSPYALPKGTDIKILGESSAARTNGMMLPPARPLSKDKTARGIAEVYPDPQVASTVGGAPLSKRPRRAGVNYQ